MIFGLARRVLGLACFALVAYAAIKVPIGRRTTWGHLTAIFTTEPAREAAEDFGEAAKAPWKGGNGPAWPSQEQSPRGKTPAPGTTHVRSAHQGVPASP